MNKPQKHLNTSNFDGVGYKPENKEIRKMKISKDENMLIAKKFIANLIKIHGKHQFSQMEERDIHKYAK